MSRRTLTCLSLAALALGAALLGWMVFAPGGSARAGGLLAYDDPATVARGKTLYGEYCASCHGPGLEGEPNWRQRDAEGYLPAPPHDPTGHTWHHPDAQLFKITKFGTEALVGGDYKSNMAGYGDQLGDDDILAILAYIKSTWPAQIIARHNGINASSN